VNCCPKRGAHFSGALCCGAGFDCGEPLHAQTDGSATGEVRD